MYAPDTTLYIVAKTIEQTIEALGTDAGSTLDWYIQNRLMVNLTKEAFHCILYIVANCPGNVRNIVNFYSLSQSRMDDNFSTFLLDST